MNTLTFSLTRRRFSCFFILSKRCLSVFIQLLIIKDLEEFLKYLILEPVWLQSFAVVFCTSNLQNYIPLVLQIQSQRRKII